ncbi:hypothetical protein BDK89_0153 [Ilumatobacter fluminis]|uniref:Phospholipase D-like protein n=1 Tax=Ilumatobacter fluminis TaxID=467091 RepID=A0A4V6Q1U9_9ACTN|nr:phospholipase D-like domain-containing protein DpdK [Ilumatobacter fluminis]TDT14598.1 hypothetical protein BDK89_0153 [Ilumatobacter fluminis]
MSARSLRTTAYSSREELADVLQSIFVSELLVPSKPLWIVSPWISDVQVIDNRTGNFSGLLTAMPQRWIRLGEVIEQHLGRGGSLTLATRPDDHNRVFTEFLKRRTREIGRERSLRVVMSADLHEKGILTQGVLLSGSMNLTYNGLRRLEEAVHLTDEDDALARARSAYRDRWGEP